MLIIIIHNLKKFKKTVIAVHAAIRLLQRLNIQKVTNLIFEFIRILFRCLHKIAAFTAMTEIFSF